MSLVHKLSLQTPLMLAPMAGGPSTPELAAAVSNAGGLGSFAASYLTPARLAADLARLRSLTSRPFAVNLFVPTPEPTVTASMLQAALKATAVYRRELDLAEPVLAPPYSDPFDALFAEVVKAKPALFSFAFGLAPAWALDECRQLGILTAGTATTLPDALALQESGVDSIILQGNEAGGHRSLFDGPAAPAGDPQLGTFALTRLAARRLRVPVIASGGIMDGAGIAAALKLGATAVQLGTAFLACPEAGTAGAYRAALTAPGPKTTALTRAFSGRWARGLTNRFLLEMAGRDAEILPFPAQNMLTRALRKAAAGAGNAELLSLWAGQGVELIRPLPAGELVALLADELRSLG